MHGYIKLRVTSTQTRFFIILIVVHLWPFQCFQ